MKHHISKLAVFFMLTFLVSYGQRSLGEEYVRSSPTYGYTEKDISDLRLKLKNTKFPQQDDYVQSLLKKEVGAGMLVSIADLIPNDTGILATYTFTYSLNGDYTLVVHRDHYDERKSPLKTAIVDSKAEIIRYKPQKAKKPAKQGGADEPATAPKLEPSGNENPNPESEPRPQ